MTPPRFLLAVDMDGTLLRADRTIADADVAAIRGAHRHGIAVTLATGRLTTGTLPTARLLGLQTPLICADGGLLIDPENGAPLHQRTIACGHASDAVDAMVAHGLIPYVFLADAIHCEPAGAVHRAAIDVWTQDLVVHASLAEATAWRRADGVSVTVGLGERGAVERAWRSLQDAHAEILDTVYFPMGATGLWAVRSLPRGCDKGEMLAHLAERMGIARPQVAAIGDWLNDLGMLKFAGRSFAMGQAPDVVRASVTDVVRATSKTGGGVAEAIAALAQPRA